MHADIPMEGATSELIELIKVRLCLQLTTTHHPDAADFGTCSCRWSAVAMPR